MESTAAAVIVLAAGAGTRMKSRTPKVMHEIGGRSLLVHAVNAAQGTSPGELVVVLRHERDRVAANLAEHDPEVAVADQDDIPGTGRAVQCGLERVTATEGTVLVTYGDVPLLDPATLRLTHLGGGACSLARYFADVYPTSRNTVVELDRALADLVRSSFDLPRSPRVKDRKSVV